MRATSIGVIPVGIAASLLLAGCGSFFNPQGTSTGSGSGSGSGSGGGNGTGGAGSVYLASAATGAVSAFSLANGQLGNLQVSGALGAQPISLAINSNHTLLWVGTSVGSVYAYTIGSTGALTLVNQIAATALASSMLFDPSGRYMLILSNSGLNAAPVLTVYTVNTSNGLLTPVNNAALGLTGGTAFQLAFANGNTLFAALGTGGVDELLFNPATGITAEHAHLNPLGNSYADTGLSVDPKGSYLFVAETGTQGVRVLTIAPNGSLTENTSQGSPYPTGAGPSAVVVGPSGNAVYVANRTDGTISQFALASSGALTPLATPKVQTGSNPASLALDSTGGFLLAACTGGMPDLEMFSIGSDGMLTSAAKVTGSNGAPTGAVAVAATH